MKNDMVLAKVIDGQPKRYFFSIVDADRTAAHALGAYVADLYSKAWNEAASKRCFDLDCVVLCDAIPGLLTSSEVLRRPDLSKVYTFRPTYHPSAAVDTSSFTKALDDGLASNGRLLFVDSPLQSDLLRFPVYQYVAVGGSFDNLHNGHRKLLMFAAALCSDELTIGITDDSMLAHKMHADFIGSFDERVQGVTDYLKMIKPSLPVRIARLIEPYGPAITDSRLQALLVSSETILGAFTINSIRRQKGYPDMEIVVLNRADAAILSSSFIREQRAKQEQLLLVES